MSREANVDFNMEDKEAVVEWFTTFCCIDEVNDDNLWIYVDWGETVKDILEKFIKANPNIAIDVFVDQDEAGYSEDYPIDYYVRNGKIITVDHNNITISLDVLSKMTSSEIRNCIANYKALMDSIKPLEECKNNKEDK